MPPLACGSRYRLYNDVLCVRYGPGTGPVVRPDGSRRTHARTQPLICTPDQATSSGVSVHVYITVTDENDGYFFSHIKFLYYFPFNMTTWGLLVLICLRKTVDPMLISNTLKRENNETFKKLGCWPLQLLPWPWNQRKVERCILPNSFCPEPENVIHMFLPAYSWFKEKIGYTIKLPILEEPT